MVIDVIYNITLLLSLTVIYAVYPLKLDTKVTIEVRIVQGLALAVVGILIMSRPAVLFEGLVFDGRTVLLGVAGFFFGTIPTAIGVVFMVIYRLMMGGSGLKTGIFTIICSSLIGLYWRHRRYFAVINKNNATGEIYLVALIIHVISIIGFLFLPRNQWATAYKAMTFSFLIIYPIAFYLLTMLLLIQRNKMRMTEELSLSKKRFTTMFEQAPIGLFLIDINNLEIVETNPAFLKLIGKENAYFEKLTLENISYKKDFKKEKHYIDDLLSGKKKIVRFDKILKRDNLSDLWTNLSLTLLQNEKGKEVQLLGIIANIDERKKMEEELLYATTHDRLTNIYNRSMFEKLLIDFDDEKYYPLTIATGDVNGLKIVNDAFGRPQGDMILVEIAQKISAEIEGYGYCGRISGDQFALLLPNTDEKRGWQLIASLKEKGKFKVQNLEISVTFGLAVKKSKDEDINEIVTQAENVMIRSKLAESPSARSKAVNTIINTLHEKSRREELHSRRVSALSIRIGQELALNSKEINDLKTVSLLHDIGKIAIDKSILEKNKELTETEWEVVKRHPETGWRILGTVGELGELANCVLTHHERIDGSGYPQGLKGEEIPLYARIIAVADAFDAMTAPRSYRKAISDVAAAKELKKYAGKQFDKNLAHIFVEKVLEISWEDL
jgi:diguanylate cyclase (GGDEF)-like protein/PAS domain S-box-containing protein